MAISFTTDPHRLSLAVSGSIYRQIEEPSGERLVTGSGCGNVFFANGSTAVVREHGLVFCQDAGGTALGTVHADEVRDLDDLARRVYELTAL